MLEITRFIVAVVFVSFALTVLYSHVQAIWLKRAEIGWRRAIVNEYKIARPVIIVAIIVLIVMGVLQWQDTQTKAIEANNLKIQNEQILKKLDDIVNKLGELEIQR